MSDHAGAASERVLGVDACKGGWVGVVLDGGPERAYVAGRIDELVAQAEGGGPIAVVAVDMPIGLPDRGRRQADMLAREILGPRRSSVFITPVRPALEAADHSSAVAVNRELAGEGTSRQAFALKPKLLQVERWVRRTMHRVVEVHPEVCFATLAGVPLAVPKSRRAGAARRRELLADAGITVAGELVPAGATAAEDDVLDAAAAAWAARRVARGEARPMPDPPEVFSDGLPCAIWL